MTFIWLFLIGIISSIVGALLGIGGGIIIVPSLIFILKMPMQNAIAISLTTIVFTSITVTIYNLKNHLVNVKLALILEITTAFCAVVASRFAMNISSNILEGSFGFFLLFISFSILKPLHFKVKNKDGQMHYSYFDPELKKKIYYNVKRLKTAILASSLAGVASGSLGIGGGVLKVPILNEVCQIPMRVATATSNLMVGITALSAGLVYFHHGYLNLNFIPWIVLGVIMGSGIGIYIKRHLNNYSIKEAFAVIMLIIGILMIIKTL
ncbi:MAG TPA: sulfite exporter TauE/SafE family protein [Candidatus Portnoybacteria bacterium]|nr:sulfite exporter TauE/SafE family protein [Candidatus Portnoybacteria bacterium]